MADKIEAVDWSTVEELKGSRLASLVNDYKEADAAVKEAEVRKEAIRVLLAEAIEPIGTKPVLCGGKRVAWVAPSTTEKLDRALLVKAGVTPAQLQKGTKQGTKAGYLKIGPVKEDGDES